MKNKVLNKLLSFVLCVAVILSVSAVAVFAETDAPQIKNVIFLIPDGAGYGSYDFANDVKMAGGLNEKFLYKTPSNTDPMTLRDYLVGSSPRMSTTGSVVDSAASGTALATGYQPDNGAVGITRNNIPKASLLEAAQYIDKSVGLISTVAPWEATPAAFAAHSTYRDNKTEIYPQIENKGIDVVLAGGFSDIWQYGASVQDVIDRGYTVITDKAQLEDVQPGDKIWANMSDIGIAPDVTLESHQATLAEMTQAAITALSGDEDGFFLMVEGAYIDAGGHSNNAHLVASEYIAFDAAFKVAVDYAKTRNDTLVIATPDHDTGGLSIKDELRQAAIEAVTAGNDYALADWEGGNHTMQDVPVWLYAPEGVEIMDGLSTVPGDTPETRENYSCEITDFAPYVADLMGIDLMEVSNDLFIDVTEIGVYFADNERFEFASGNKVVYRNNPVYEKDGVQYDLGYKLPVYVNERFYVPADVLDEDDWNYVGQKFDGIPGSGTQEDPYLIKNSYDFIEFSKNVNEGETYEGAYFMQTANLDITAAAYLDDYNGMSPTATFAGIYDGNSKTLTVKIESSKDNCVFPRVSGTVMNLGTAGTVKTSKTYVAGIAKSLAPTGKLLNCYTTAELTGKIAGGLVYNNYGKIINSYFGGKINASQGVHAVALKHGNGKFAVACYDADYVQLPDNGTIAETDVDVQLLNDSRRLAAIEAGCDLAGVAVWGNDSETGLYQYMAKPTVDEIIILPLNPEVKKGESLQFTVSVLGENNPSQEVLWSIEPASAYSTITADGLLTVSADETASTLTVMAKSKQDGSRAATVTVTVTE